MFATKALSCNGTQTDLKGLIVLVQILANHHSINLHMNKQNNYSHKLTFYQHDDITFFEVQRGLE